MWHCRPGYKEQMEAVVKKRPDSLCYDRVLSGRRLFNILVASRSEIQNRLVSILGWRAS